MKLQIVSDLHLDTYTYPDKVLDMLDCSSDKIIMAGDIICTGFENQNSPIPYLKKFANRFKDKQIVYVPGNHDLWGTSITKGIEQLKKPIAENLIILYNEKITIDQQEFVGTTLWIKEDPLAPFYWDGYVDFDRITNYHTTYANENSKAINYLDTNMHDTSIVITHFVPHELSIHKKYKGDPYNMFFVCDISDLIYKHQPKLVIHGHTHEYFDYVIDHERRQTRVVCNPLGYEFENSNKPFKNLIVEV